MSSNTSDNAVVEVEICDRTAWVSGSVAPLIAPELTYQLHGFSIRPNGTCEATKGSRQYFWPDGEGDVGFPAGLASRVVRILDSHGLAAVVRDHRRDSESLQPNQKLYASLHEDSRRLLDAVREHRQGQLLVQNDAARIETIGLILRYLRGVGRLVLTATKRDVEKIANKLRPYLPVQTGAEARRRQHDWPVVATLASNLPEDRGRWGVVIYAHPEQLAAKEPSISAMCSDSPRVYGITQAGLRLTHRTQLVVEGLCGPEIFEKHGAGGVPADVRVLMVHAPWSPAPGDCSALERKRIGYWHNAARNQVIATVATAFSNKDAEVLWQHGLLLDEEDDRLLESAQALRVLIVVESLEHGRALHEQLAGWRLAVDDAQNSARQGPAALDRTILTMVQADRLNLLDSDLVVWAIGGRSYLDCRGFPPRTAPGVRREIVLVDFADDFDEAAVAETATRRDAYRARGWQLPRRRTLGHGRSI